MCKNYVGKLGDHLLMTLEGCILRGTHSVTPASKNPYASDKSLLLHTHAQNFPNILIKLLLFLSGDGTEPSRAVLGRPGCAFSRACSRVGRSSQPGAETE